MGKLWLHVLVLLQIQFIYANAREENFSCDECIRSASHWCTNPEEIDRCVTSVEDSWCPQHKVSLPVWRQHAEKGQVVMPAYAERSLFINVPDRLDISYEYTKESKSIPVVQVSILNTTQTNEVKFENWTSCKNGICNTTLEAKPTVRFCNANGTTNEVFYAKVVIEGVPEEVLVKYQVPCACPCSAEAIPNAEQCKGHGKFVCGICACYDGWTGEFCNVEVNTIKGGGKGSGAGGSSWPGGWWPGVVGSWPGTKGNRKPDCEGIRGDLRCSDPNKPWVKDCSGNGKCEGPCDTCICDQNREGSQYLKPENYCEDICTETSHSCDDCFLNNTLGVCDGCIVQKYDETLLEQRDSYNNKMWVRCNETVDKCYVEYVAMKDENEEIYLMVVRTCNDKEFALVGAAGGGNVSLILGILALIACVAAVGGVMLWKHMNAVSPVAPSNSRYMNIEAEGSTGLNPLYKPPMSQFKNPTYGK